MRAEEELEEEEQEEEVFDGQRWRGFGVQDQSTRHTVTNFQ